MMISKASAEVEGSSINRSPFGSISGKNRKARTMEIGVNTR